MAPSRNRAVIPGCVGGGPVVCFGTGSLGPATGKLVAGGITEQTVRVLENVKAVMAEADCVCTMLDRRISIPGGIEWRGGW